MNMTNPMIINALLFITESITDSAINFDEIIDLDNDPETFAEFCEDNNFDAEAFNAARAIAVTIHNAQ